MLLLCVLGSLFAGDHAGTGPWDMPALRKPPTVEWLKRDQPEKQLLLVNEPYRGRTAKNFAYYGLPADAGSGNRKPAVLVLHGAGGYAVRSKVETWTKRGYAVLVLDYAACGENGNRLPEAISGPLMDTENFFLVASPKTLKDVWFYHAVAAAIRGISFLRTQPEVDPERIGIEGSSMGGIITCLVASLDADRVRFAIPIQGCGFLDRTVWGGEMAKMTPANRKLWMDTFDPSVYMPRCTVPILALNGTSDMFFYLRPWTETFRLCKGPVTVLMHGHWYHNCIVDQIPEIPVYADSLCKGGPPLSRIERTWREGDAISAKVGGTAAINASYSNLPVAQESDVDFGRFIGSAQIDPVSRTLTRQLPPHATVWYASVQDERGLWTMSLPEFLPGIAPRSVSAGKPIVASAGDCRSIAGETGMQHVWEVPATGQWLAIDLGSEVVVDRWSVVYGSYHSLAYGLLPWPMAKLQKSKDGTAWEDVDEVNDNRKGRLERLVPPFSARHVRFVFAASANPGAGDMIRVRAVGLYAPLDGP